MSELEKLLESVSPYCEYCTFNVPVHGEVHILEDGNKSCPRARVRRVLPLLLMAESIAEQAEDEVSPISTKAYRAAKQKAMEGL